MSTYKIAFKQSRQAEKELALYLLEKNYIVQLARTDIATNYDIIMTAKTKNYDEIVYSFEVKNETYKRDKVYVEYKKIINNEEKKTGITETEATYYAFKQFSTNQFFIIKTDKLKELCFNAEYENNRTYHSNSERENYRYFNVVFNKSFLFKHGKLINI